MLNSPANEPGCKAKRVVGEQETFMRRKRNRSVEDLHESNFGPPAVKFSLAALRKLTESGVSQSRSKLRNKTSFRSRIDRNFRKYASTPAKLKSAIANKVFNRCRGYRLIRRINNGRFRCRSAESRGLKENSGSAGIASRLTSSGRSNIIHPNCCDYDNSYQHLLPEG